MAYPRAMFGSARVAGRLIANTLDICVPTVAEGARGTLTMGDCDERLARWSKKLVADLRIRLAVTGREHIRPEVSYVIMSNHQSLVDIPVLYQSIPGSVRMVAKKEMFRVPFLGPAMKAAGFINVDRSNRQRAIDSLTEAQAQLQRGISVWIAPEGTRSSSGVLGPFKKGGFYLAQNTGAPILPVSVWGTRDVLPARTARLRFDVPVDVRVGAPIDSAVYGKEQRGELMDTVRRSLLELLPPEAASAE